jgi:hypothetical protein
MSLFVILLILAWLFLLVTLFSTLKTAGLCSEAEQRQADKRLFEKRQRDPDHAA